MTTASMEFEGLDLRDHQFILDVPTSSEPASGVVLSSNQFRFVKRRFEDGAGFEDQGSARKIRAVAGPARKAYDDVRFLSLLFGL